MEKLHHTWKTLNQLQPRYFSVTFGAGGSTQQKTADTVFALIKDGLDAAPHMSCIDTQKATIQMMLKAYQAKGVKRLVALRGDFPEDMEKNPGDFHHANELVQFIREETGSHFHIEIAAYPETHPQASDFETDFAHFKQKVAVGADGAITQYFFELDAYKRFMESCEKANITIPVIPGIMPIGNVEKLLRFSNRCGAKIPKHLHDRLNAFGNNTESIIQYGIEVVTNLCRDLLAFGAPGLHFYTLNQTHPTMDIVKNLL